MPQFSADLDALYGQRDFMQRFAAAAQAGFDGVEFMFPYAHPVEQIAHQLCSHALQLVQLSLPAGDWSAGERGIACHPERGVEFRRGVDAAIRYARALGVRQLNCLAGIAPAGVTAQQARETLVQNLRSAAATLKQHGIALLVVLDEAAHDSRSHLLLDVRQTLDVIRDAGSDNLFLDYGIGRRQWRDGELLAAIEAALPVLRHLRLDDIAPADYAGLPAMLDRLGYRGWIGCPFDPLARTPDGLNWRGTDPVTLSGAAP